MTQFAFQLKEFLATPPEADIQEVTSLNSDWSFSIASAARIG